MTVLVSYQGGSAGDLLTASLNQIPLSFDQHSFVQPKDFTVKDSNINTLVELVQAATNKTWEYVSTHNFNLLLNSNLDWLSIEVTDPATKELCVLRQMRIQRLKILVDADSHWYRIVKALCDKAKYHDAANYWFSLARDRWLHEMDARVNTLVPKRINFNNLFSADFYDSILQQGYDIPILKDNHSHWLNKNSADTVTKETTIDSMSNKLSQMDWSLESGMVIYHGSQQ